MQRLLEYIGHHPYLAGAAVIAALAVLVAEIRERMSGFAALSSMQAVRLMNQGALVLDLRPKESFEAGHIADARNVPAAELAGIRRHAEEMAREDRDHLLRQRRERRCEPRAR